MAILWCKTAFFNRAWHIVIVPPSPWASRSILALNRPLKWGTVCLWTLSGSKDTGRQSWKNEKNLQFPYLNGLFFVFSALTACVSLEPLGVQRHTVPHFKGLIKLYLDLQAQRRDSTFTFCHAQLKKSASGRFILSSTVHKPQPPFSYILSLS